VGAEGLKNELRSGSLAQTLGPGTVLDRCSNVTTRARARAGFVLSHAGEGGCPSFIDELILDCRQVSRDSRSCLPRMSFWSGLCSAAESKSLQTLQDENYSMGSILVGSAFRDRAV
jgi:hypothetical protein